MSITGIPSVQLKDLAQGYRPWIAYTITMADGSVFGFGTATDNITDSVTWNGQAYWCAITDQRLEALQASDTLGITSFGNIGITLADADATWWGVETRLGFEGASITADLTFFDTNTNTFASTSTRIFAGICDAATHAGQLTTITAVSNYSLQKSIVPIMPVQRNCPKNFPTTAAQRKDGTTNAFSIYWDCGYAPDQGGYGNLDSSGQPYTSCDYTRASCTARGMFSNDSRGRGTARFGGSEWVPPATWKGKSYTQGKTITGVNTENLRKYKQYIPLTFGTTWVNAVIANVVGDPNSTVCEALLAYGDFGSGAKQSIQTVLCNGLAVPASDQTSDLLFRYYFASNGNRQGYFHQGPIYSGQGDPYGSIFYIIVDVYNQVAASNTPPSVQALLSARPIPIYTDSHNYFLQGTDLVGWVVLELIRLARPDLYKLIDFTSVASYSAICGTSIGYTKLDGSTGYHRRFGVSISLEQPTSLSTVIQSLMIAGNLMIVPNPTGTGFQFKPKLGLCDSQPNWVTGSNNNTGYPSYRITDNPNGAPTGTGFFAYDFNDTNILAGSVKVTQDTIARQPTVWQTNIQDEDNQYTPDSVSIANLDLYSITQQKNTATYNVAGLPNYDQAYRVIESKMAETSQGNPRKDNKGTWVISWDTTFLASHLTLGQIVRFSWLPLAIAPTALRIEAIAPTGDYRKATLTGRWTDDRWYTDGWGGTQTGTANTAYPNAGGWVSVSESTDSSGNQTATVSWSTWQTSGHIAVYAGSSGGSVVGTGLAGSVTQTVAQWTALGAPPFVCIDLTTGRVIASYNGPL
jgi:hypothetical protein